MSNTKWNKSEEISNTVWYNLYMKSTKIQQTSKHNKKEADTENKLMAVGRGNGAGTI